MTSLFNVLQSGIADLKVDAAYCFYLVECESADSICEFGHWLECVSRDTGC